MERRSKEYYKKKLLQEKARVEGVLNIIKENDLTTKDQIDFELSYYDNHPADLASAMTNREEGRALKGNEISLMNKINSALEDLEKGNYGTCKLCGKHINNERLDFVPYAEYCTKCQNSLESSRPNEENDRPIEEEVLGNPFGYGYNDYNFDDDVGFDAEDTYQAVDFFNWMPNVFENYEADEEFVDPIESISNEEYKNQLPD